MKRDCRVVRPSELCSYHQSWWHQPDTCTSGWTGKERKSSLWAINNTELCFGLVPLTIWLQSVAFPQVDPFASFGQRSEKVAHQSPTLQMKGEPERKGRADTPESFLSSDDQTLMERFASILNTTQNVCLKVNDVLSYIIFYLYRYSSVCLVYDVTLSFL